jgi:hypothetical protein
MTSALHPRVAPEIAAIHQWFPGTVLHDSGGETLLEIPYESGGWTPNPLRVIVKVPPLYPEQRPDLIFLDGEARRPGGGIPCQVMQRVPLDGREWQQISWHFTEPYDSAQMNLLRFAQSVMVYLGRCQ